MVMFRKYRSSEINLSEKAYEDETSLSHSIYCMVTQPEDFFKVEIKQVRISCGT